MRRVSIADTSTKYSWNNSTMNNVAERLLHLETRQGELLDKLALLDQQIDDVLKEWTAIKETQPEGAAPVHGD